MCDYFLLFQDQIGEKLFHLQTYNTHHTLKFFVIGKCSNLKL